VSWRIGRIQFDGGESAAAQQLVDLRVRLLTDGVARVGPSWDAEPRCAATPSATESAMVITPLAGSSKLQVHMLVPSRERIRCMQTLIRSAVTRKRVSITAITHNERPRRRLVRGVFTYARTDLVGRPRTCPDLPRLSMRASAIARPVCRSRSEKILPRKGRAGSTATDGCAGNDSSSVQIRDSNEAVTGAGNRLNIAPLSLIIAERFAESLKCEPREFLLRQMSPAKPNREARAWLTVVQRCALRQAGRRTFLGANAIAWPSFDSRRSGASSSKSPNSYTSGLAINVKRILAIS
jgi:hypothetical protein